MASGVGVLGIVIEDRERAAQRVNQLLSEYGHLVVGRMGVPYREEGVFVIALIVDGSSDEIGALSGRLGSLPGVRVKSSLVTRRD
ncbi:MAG: CopG family transcriptional regulator [Firmicutes bacterium]|nr:CopG family transcriptional regulator [Bacillota bacterium]